MTNDWTPDDSATYRALSQIAVPARLEQLATLLTLIPFKQSEAFRVVELASGEGYLSAAILEAFPKSYVLALDYEESMRDATKKRLESYGRRAAVGVFDIQQIDWFDRIQGANLVMSSLCVHHLDSDGKKRLFRAVRERLSTHGAFLLADLVMPQVPQARELFAKTWDSMAESASIERTLSRDLFERFEQEQWNYYHYPDAFDKPDPLFSQLQWLDKAGFLQVDCFWMQAGHAIYGGYRGIRGGSLTFGDALNIAQKILTD